MKKELTLFFCLLFTVRVYAMKPLAGITGFKNNSPRTVTLAGMLENHIINIINISGLFDIVNTKLLRDELVKFECLEEKCIIRFAKTSKMGIVINGEFDDRGDSLILTLNAFGIDIPYNGKLIYKYRVEIPMSDAISSREYSYICEEHAGRFIAKVLFNYKYPVSLKADKNIIKADEEITGKYTLFRYINNLSQFKTYKSVGEVYINNGVVDKEKSSGNIKERDFLLVSNKRKAEFFEKFYYGRKREIVLNEPSITDTFYTVLFTVPASAGMPFAAPLLGYYRNSDWSGLILWSLNASPYIYMEYKGFTDVPDGYRKNNRDIESEVIAGNRFAYYMLFTGGLALFVDAFSQQYLSEAAGYEGMIPLMGNSYTAAYMSLVSGGAGHFYRGYRFWGYLYFHINNILLYYTIKEFSPSEIYDRSSGSYRKESINKKRAYRFASAYGIFKIVEITHALLLDDRIQNGKILESGSAVEPVMFFDHKNYAYIGLQYTYKFN